MAEIKAYIDTRLGNRMVMLSRALPEETNRVLEQLALDAEIELQSVAPKGETLRLARSIHTLHYGPGLIEIIADARNPTTGYEYIGVTRFGHRRLSITPTGRAPASVIATTRRRRRGRTAVLRYVWHGAIFFRRKVRAQRPATDWVQSGMQVIEQRANLAITVLGRRVRRWL